MTTIISDKRFLDSDIIYTGCLKKNAMEIQQAVVYHKTN
jgi:hypothetical protein